MNNIFEALHSSQQAAKRAKDQDNRVIYPILAIVTEVKNRKIRVADPANPLIASDWLYRAAKVKGSDPRTPDIGNTVLCFFVNGLSFAGYYLPVENETNPFYEDKENPDNSDQDVLPGNQITHIKGRQEITVDESILIKTKSGSSIFLDDDGSITLTSASGKSITLDDLIQISSNIVKIGGSDVLTIGSQDTGGFINITKGTY